MAKFITLNTVKHQGKEYYPGAEIEVSGETKEWLLKNGAIRPAVDEVIEEDEGEKLLEDMNVAELKTVALDNEIDVTGLMLKADIFEAVNAGLAE